MRNTWVIYPEAGDNVPKGTLIPHKLTGPEGPGSKAGDPQGPGTLGGARVLSASWRGNGPPRRLTGSWPERVVSHTGTETLPRLLREAAVEDLLQWAQA